MLRLRFSHLHCTVSRVICKLLKCITAVPDYSNLLDHCALVIKKKNQIPTFRLLRSVSVLPGETAPDRRWNFTERFATQFARSVLDSVVDIGRSVRHRQWPGTQCLRSHGRIVIGFPVNVRTAHLVQCRGAAPQGPGTFGRPHPKPPTARYGISLATATAAAATTQERK
jgi:hypothetical protein